jgi:hypothetical protein
MGARAVEEGVEVQEDRRYKGMYSLFGFQVGFGAVVFGNLRQVDRRGDLYVAVSVCWKLGTDSKELRRE